MKIFSVFTLIFNPLGFSKLKKNWQRKTTKLSPMTIFMNRFKNYTQALQGHEKTRSLWFSFSHFHSQEKRKSEESVASFYRFTFSSIFLPWQNISFTTWTNKPTKSFYATTNWENRKNYEIYVKTFTIKSMKSVARLSADNNKSH